MLASAGALGLTPPLTLVGHSLGGLVALRAAALGPAAIGRVILLDIAPGSSGRVDGVAAVLDVVVQAADTFASRAEARSVLTTAGLAPALADWVLLNLESAGEAVRWRIDRRALAALHARVAGEDLWPVVEGTRAWALRCVRGGASPYVRETDVRRLEAAGCPVTTIEGVGHFLHAERPREVVDAVVAALADV